MLSIGSHSFISRLGDEQKYAFSSPSTFVHLPYADVLALFILGQSSSTKAAVFVHPHRFKTPSCRIRGKALSAHTVCKPLGALICPTIEEDHVIGSTINAAVAKNLLAARKQHEQQSYMIIDLSLAIIF